MFLVCSIEKPPHIHRTHATNANFNEFHLQTTLPCSMTRACCSTESAPAQPSSSSFPRKCKSGHFWNLLKLVSIHIKSNTCSLLFGGFPHFKGGVSSLKTAKQGGQFSLWGIFAYLPHNSSTNQGQQCLQQVRTSAWNTRKRVTEEKEAYLFGRLAR